MLSRIGILLILIFGASNYGVATQLIFEEGQERIPLGLQLEYLEDPSGKLTLSGGGHFEVISSDNVSDNQWHTVYFSAKSSSIALYPDGSQLASNTSTVDHLDMTKNQIGVGRFGRSSNWDGLVSTQVYYYNGLIDDFKFYSGALH